MSSRQPKFTFKTSHPTGRYRSFDDDEHYVKFKRVEVGSIDDAKPHTIRLMVVKKDIMEDNNPNCTWKWIRLKREFNSVDEAKQFLNDNISTIMEQFRLVGREND